MARKLSGWGFNIIATDPFIDASKAAALGVELHSFDEVLSKADYLSVHVPLLPETHHLLDETAFSRMKPGVMLVNTARGPLVKQSALLDALQTGIVSRAGMDVFENEPLPGNSPMRKHPGIIISDHTAWYSEESQVILQQRAAEEIVRVCKGQAPFSLANLDLVETSERFANWEPPELIRWQFTRLKQL
jgi:D-3-phosphoglycerate dehydrogenase